MKRMMLILGAVLLAGCDAGEELLGKGAAAEAAGSFKEAAELYRSVCAKGAPLCPMATQRADRVGLKNARKALDEGRYRDAKSAIDAALTASDAGVKRAAEVMSKLADLETGLVWEEASASASNQLEALPKIEAVANAGVAASPPAREWLAKNRPRILLERVKAACAPAGSGSCVEASAELTRRDPASPEGAEAQKLVEADYAQIFPRFQEAETLLGRIAYLCDQNKKVTKAHEEECQREDGMSDLHCLRTQEPVQLLPTSAVEASWKKKLDEIHDPFFVKPLEARWPLASNSCEYDAETRPKPVGKK